MLTINHARIIAHITGNYTQISRCRKFLLVWRSRELNQISANSVSFKSKGYSRICGAMDINTSRCRSSLHLLVFSKRKAPLEQSFQGQVPTNQGSSPDEAPHPNPSPLLVGRGFDLCQALKCGVRQPHFSANNYNSPSRLREGSGWARIVMKWPGWERPTPKAESREKPLSVRFPPGLSGCALLAILV